MIGRRLPSFPESGLLAEISSGVHSVPISVRWASGLGEVSSSNSKSVLQKVLQAIRVMDPRTALSSSSWFGKRVKQRREIWQTWLKARETGQSVGSPWNIIRHETGLDRSKGLSCTNTLSNRIPTLPLIPFYDRVYMWIFNLDWNDRFRPPITTVSDFKRVHGLDPDEVLSLAEEGSIVPVPHIEEDMNPEFMSEFFSRLEKKDAHFLPKAYAYMLANDFQIENRIYLPRLADPEYELVEGLCYVGGLESIWAIEGPIPGLSPQTLGVLEQTMRAISKSPLFQENTVVESFLDGLGLAYSPEMPLKEYVRVFTPDRRKELRLLIAGAIKGEKPIEDVISETNKSIHELEERSRSRGWKLVSRVSSLMKANALTLVGGAAGWVRGGLGGLVVAAVLAYLAQMKMPDEVSKDLSKLEEKIVLPISAMILRRSPSVLHVVQMTKSLAEMRRPDLARRGVQ